MTDVNDTKASKRVDARIPRFSPQDLLVVGVDSIGGVTADSEDPRGKLLYTQLYDERVHMPLDVARLAMTRTHGVDVPVQYVRWGAVYLVVDGRRRTLYARAILDEQTAAGLPAAERITVPAVPFTGKLEEAFARSRSMNQFEESSPMMRARDIARMLAEPVPDPDSSDGTRTRTTKEVAAILGVSDQTVLNYRALFGTSDAVKAALSKELSGHPTVAMMLAGLPEAQQMEALEELREVVRSGKKLTNTEGRRAVDKVKGRKGQTPKAKLEAAQKALRKLARVADEAPTSPTVEVLAAIDAVARAVFRGEGLFPEPARAQDAGYTLAALLGPAPDEEGEADDE